MKKEMKITLISCFGLFIILSSFGVFAFGFTDFWNKLTGNVVQECFDSDGNGNYRVSGYCEDINGVHFDGCTNNASKDWRCIGNVCEVTAINPCEVWYSGTVCMEGACIVLGGVVPKNVSSNNATSYLCNDSDGDGNFRVSGYCEDSHGIHFDECVNSGSRDWKCNGIVCEVTAINPCDAWYSGTVCMEGACILPGGVVPKNESDRQEGGGIGDDDGDEDLENGTIENGTIENGTIENDTDINCLDSDGADYRISGNCTDNNGIHYDGCVGNASRDWNCVDGLCQVTAISPCSAWYSGTVCQNGACVIFSSGTVASASSLGGGGGGGGGGGNPAPKNLNPSTSETPTNLENKEIPMPPTVAWEPKTITVNVQESKVVGERLEAVSRVKLKEVGGKFYASNNKGLDVPLKISPDEAVRSVKSQVNTLDGDAIEIEITEYKDNIVYSVRIEAKIKIMGFMPSSTEVSAKISIEDGTIIKIEKPWWSFLASGV